MRIEELLIESYNLEEGPLDGVGRAVGNVAGGVANAVGGVAGGIKGVGDKFKQGFNSGRKYVNGVSRGQEQGTAKSPYYDLSGIAPGQQGGGNQQGGGAPAQGQDPNQLRAQGKALIKQADDLEKQQKSQQQQQNTQSAGGQQQQQPNNQPAPTDGQQGPKDAFGKPIDTPQADGQQQPPAQEPPATSTPGATPPADANATTPPAGTAPTTNAPTTNAPTTNAPATNAPAGTPPASGKLSQQQIDQKKAEMKSRRAGGTNMAAAGGTGYKDSRTGVGVQKPSGIGPDGKYKYTTVREEWQFESRFLGMRI